MQGINSRRAANGQGEDHLFLSAQWLLRVPLAILEDLGRFGKFVENGANGIGRKQGSARGRRIAASQFDLHTLNALKLIGGGAREDIRDPRGATHTEDGGDARRFRFGLSDPEHVTVGIVAKHVVVKIESELAEFPELIGDVIAGVSDGAIRTHDDLV